MAQKFLVRNAHDVRIPISQENGVRMILGKDETCEFSTRGAAESAANDFNASTPSNIKLTVETVDIEDAPVAKVEDVPAAKVEDTPFKSKKVDKDA